MSAGNTIEHKSAASTTRDAGCVRTLPTRNIDLLNGDKRTDNRLPIGVNHRSTDCGCRYGIGRYPYQGKDNE
jgi:hypothetical protein